MRTIRRAFTLIEMVVVLAVAGIVFTMAMPKFADAVATSNRLSAARAAAAYLAQAKALAIENGRPARVSLSGTTLFLLAGTSSGGFSVRAQRDFTAEYGVTVAMVPFSTVQFDARGMIAAVNLIPPTIVVTRDGKSDRACVVGLAKISVNQCGPIQ